MRDAIGGSMLLTLVVVFTSIVIIFFAGILAYSKAYKAKNKIIEIIEKHNGNIVNHSVLNDFVREEMGSALELMGYRVSNTGNLNNKCQQFSNNCTAINQNLNDTGYRFCVCKANSSSGNMYEVVTFVQFEFPVIGDLLEFPVKGETRILGKTYEY